MLEVLHSLLTAFTILLSALGVGRPVLRLLRVEPDSLLATSVWSLALGLTTCGWTFAILGLFGWINEPVLGVFTLAAGFWGALELACLCLGHESTEQGRLPAEESVDSHPWSIPPLGLTAAVTVLTAIVVAASLINALAPTTSPEALERQLELPKSVLLAGSILDLQHGFHAAPQLLTLWYSWALLLDGPVAAALLHWMLGGLLCCATMLLARSLVGPRWAPVSGAVVLLTPGIAWQIAVPLDDVALALFTTLTLAAWYQAAIELASPRWFLVAGAMFGAAIGIKSTGLSFGLAMECLWFWTLLRRAEHRVLLLQGWSMFVLSAAAVGGLWYVKAILLPGVLSPAEFHHEILAHLGPLPLALLPGVFLVRRLRGMGAVLLTAAVYALGCLALFRHCRWWSPLVPLLAIAATWVWIELARFPRMPRLMMRCGVAGLVSLGAMAPFQGISSRVKVALGWQSRQEYLLEREGTFRAAQVAAQLLDPDRHSLLSADSRAFYFSCRVTALHRFLTNAESDQSPVKASHMLDSIREAGFTHLLLAEPIEPISTTSDNQPGQALEAALRTATNKQVLPLADYWFAERDGVTRRYRLLMLR